MAGGNKSKPASVADVKRLVAAAVSTKNPKQKRARKQNTGGSGSAPVAVASSLTNRGPKQGAGPNGSVRISNTEFVTDLASGSSIQAFDLNPCSSPLFTWLSRIAVGYELFRFVKMRFRYTPICPSSTTGVVVMAFDYDASDAAPLNKQAITAYSGSARGNVWNTVWCDIKPPTGWFYCGNIGNVPNPANTDIKFYDVAKFYIGLFNTSGTAATGELSVEYVVDFSKPDFGPAPSPSEVVLLTGSTYSNLCGTSQNAVGTLPVILSSPASGTLVMTFPIAGTFTTEFATSPINSTSAVNNAWTTIFQNDPGANVTTTVPWLDWATTAWTNASSSWYAVNVFAASVLAGTTITISLNTAVTAATISKIRFSSFAKALQGL